MYGLTNLKITYCYFNFSLLENILFYLEWEGEIAYRYQLIWRLEPLVSRMSGRTLNRRRAFIMAEVVQTVHDILNGDSLCCGAATQRGSWTPHSWGFLDHTQWRNILGRTPLDEWSSRRRDLYPTTFNIYNRQTSMPPVGLEPTISAGKRRQT